jgi:hypothetical protein
MSMVVFLSIISGFSLPVLTLLLSKKPFLIKSDNIRYLTASLLGFVLWMVLIALFRIALDNGWDIICGTLILLCAVWSNFWLSNFGGGFRMNMLLKIAEQERPITINEWMKLFGGLGMEVFLQDRLNSVLIPLRIVEQKDGMITLTIGRGYFFGRLMQILYHLLQGSRRE